MLGRGIVRPQNSSNSMHHSNNIGKVMIKIKPSLAIPPILLLALIGIPLRSMAHGVMMEATPIPSFKVKVQYESGEPMANAQINVYAPTDPQNIWLQTLTDDNGYFLFTPDPGIRGTWEIQARLAGHGELLQINVQKDGAIRQLTQSSSTPFQKWLTIAAVVWGFTGTALFFSRTNSQSQPVTPTESQ